jgi:hypothetical protein
MEMVVRCRPMKNSSARRVLKSVVGPALGATLGALVAGGCAKEEAKPTPTSTETQPAVPPQPEATKPPSAVEPPKEPGAAEAATPVEPEKPAAGAIVPDAATPPAPAPDKTDAKKTQKKEGAKATPKKGVTPPPDDKKDEPKKSPSTEWYAGTMLERDIRPMRPARRGTDATIHALMTGLHDPALRPLA